MVLPESDVVLPESDVVLPESDVVLPESDVVSQSEFVDGCNNGVLSGSGLWSNTQISGCDTGLMLRQQMHPRGFFVHL